jgi:hypothetical protein
MRDQYAVERPLGDHGCQHIEYGRNIVHQRQVDPLGFRRDREPAVTDGEKVRVPGARQQMAQCGIEDAAALHLASRCGSSPRDT